jgi:competence protein ComEC
MQAFVGAKNYQVIDQTNGNAFKDLLHGYRSGICNVLKKNIKGDKEAGLAEALLVGFKDDLDKELLKAYSNTGVVHVIAISGLHLGILYIICKRFLLLIPVFRNRKFLTSVVIIMFLWLFSLLTGGSPSVLRSAVMFTAILIGESFSRKISIYNCLAASAFLLLSYRPYWIFDIGFQLSYCAVLSIVIFYKLIYQKMFIKNILLDKLWRMIAVTLSAQILTTPVSLYYFHQFPNYFLPANLVAVPLSTVALVGEIILCTVSFIPRLSELTGNLVTWTITVMNNFVTHIDALPFAVTSGINITLMHALLMYGFIAAVSVYVIHNQKKALACLLIIILTFALLNLHRHFMTVHRQILIVYNIKGKQVIALIDAGKMKIAGMHGWCNEKTCSQIINASLVHFGIRHKEKMNIPQMIAGEKYTVQFLTGSRKSTTAKPTALIVLTDMKADADSVLLQLRPSVVVLDAAHSASSIRMWTKACNKEYINLHPVGRKGAFVMHLN